MSSSIALNPATAFHIKGLINSTPNAIIVTGALGIGKQYLIENLLANIFDCTNLQTLDHPYIRWLKPLEGKAISIEQIRQLDRFVNLRVPATISAHFTVNRAIVIHPDQLTVSLPAQNAVLKLLEEPPVGTVIFIASARTGGLLPTIRSRSQTLHVFSPSKTELQQSYIVQGLNPASIDFESAYAICGGLPGLLYSYLTVPDHPLKAAVLVARQILGQSSFERLNNMDALVKNKPLALDVLQIIGRMSGMALHGATGSNYNRWQRALEASTKAQTALLASAQTKLVLTDLMLSLWTLALHHPSLVLPINPTDVDMLWYKHIMYELLILVVFAGLALHHSRIHEDEFANVSRRVGDRIGKLWDIAHQGMRENRFLRAEKALLTILKIDEKNAAAYNRLGILYAKQKEFRDAIDCFEIASSIEPTPSSLHNLGLIYFETENYEKAAIAFEEAIKFDDGLAARHVAYAKVQEKLGNDKLMFAELKKAVELEPNKETYTLLHKAYLTHGMQAEADIAADRLKKYTSPKAPAGRAKRMLRPRRVVV